MAQLVKVSDRARVITSVFKENQTRMLRLAPKTTSDPNRLLSIAYAAIAYDSQLVQCTPESLFGGVVEALKLGLTLGGPMQEAWLIPFKNRRGSEDLLEATMIVGYMGYRNIIDRAGSVIDMHPRAVHVKDYEEGNFDWGFGDRPFIHHKTKLPQPEKEKDLFAVYLVANLRRGGRQMEVMLRDEVNAHRARSRAASNARSPWNTDYVPMALKTVVRKTSKYLPKSSDLLARALQLDEQADMGQPQTFDIEELDLGAAAQLGEGTSGGSALDKITKATRGATGAPVAGDIEWGGSAAEPSSDNKTE
jgi:recombination protein RecT